jgi:hypothetical protein
MRTLGEYKNAFGQVSDSVLSRPFNTKAQARHLVALANQAVRTARNTFTQEITMTWKQGFVELKTENDRLQEESKVEYEQEVNACHEDDMRANEDAKAEFPLVGGKRGTGYSMAIRQANIEHKACLLAARNNRREGIKDISAKWKEGFAQLKAENDQMQKDLMSAFKDELQMIDERLGDMYEGLQG